ncbi:MAG: tRNA pseudouridine(13) synthase TruD [Planctomycetota bacterium]
MEPAYLTADRPGTGGRLRARPEDFRVEEIPLYEPAGEGEFVYVRITKRKLSTFEAIRRMARALQIEERRISYAGLKDARAVTSQWLCAEDVSIDAVRGLRVAGLTVGEVRRHGNRLKVGHLRGNRFRIVVRNAVPDAVDRAEAVLEVLVRRGVPNAFGGQRFGTRRDSHRYGEAMIRRDYEGFLRRFLGNPSELEHDRDLRRSRELYDQGRVRDAYEAMPTRYRGEKKALHALLRFGEAERAFFAVPLRLRQMFASSFQSSLFNRVLGQRLPDLDRLEPGDLAYLHRNGAVFAVEDAAAEQPRCDCLEISPSGPLFGTHAPLAAGGQGEREAAVLAATGLGRDDFAVGGGVRCKGGRRPLRVPLKDVAMEKGRSDGTLVLKFALPAGSFATTVLGEILKTEV